MTQRYLVAWFALAALAIANGVLRETTYGRVVSELAAHQISTVTACGLFGGFAWCLSRLWPLSSSAQAWRIGALWLVCTIAFEFGFGHFVAGHSWERLFADYDLTRGRIWALCLVWIAVLPYLSFRWSRPGPMR